MSFLEDYRKQFEAPGEQTNAVGSLDEPFFSILIPCYNVESYIEECIRSVADQTFTSWEIVAVDDGSTDGTPSLLLESANSIGSKMTVVCCENQGQLLSRCEALSRARGKYVVFLDADDMLRSDALDVVFHAISKYPDALVQFKSSRSADYRSELHPSYPGVAKLPSVVGIESYRRWVCESNSFNNLWGKAIPLSAAISDEDYSEFSYVRNAEDLLQLAAMLDNIDKVVLMGDVLYYYRANPKSVTRTFQVNYYVSVKAAHTKLLAQALKWGDLECVRLLRPRCLNAVHASVAQLAGSGYSPSAIRRELAKIGNDRFFLDAWAASDDSATKRDPLLLMLRMRMYGLLSWALYAKGKLHRPRGALR